MELDVKALSDENLLKLAKANGCAFNRPDADGNRPVAARRELETRVMRKYRCPGTDGFNNDGLSLPMKEITAASPKSTGRKAASPKKSTGPACVSVCISKKPVESPRAKALAKIAEKAKSPIKNPADSKVPVRLPTASDIAALREKRKAGNPESASPATTESKKAAFREFLKNFRLSAEEKSKSVDVYHEQYHVLTKQSTSNERNKYVNMDLVDLVRWTRSLDEAVQIILHLDMWALSKYNNDVTAIAQIELEYLLQGAVDAPSNLDELYMQALVQTLDESSHGALVYHTIMQSVASGDKTNTWYFSHIEDAQAYLEQALETTGPKTTA